ncbi:MAG: hypothetical protein O7G85_01895 [Planctomycetota bacterium]|nr:hypothetical protein [Planctomycetota bacterium]
MTSPKPMRIEELLEFSALDAFGLLDEYEAELYTRSFHHAPAAVQDEILRIQAELNSDASLLPSDMPESELRQKVLNAVARAIEEDARELAPLASIGQRFSIASHDSNPAPTRLMISGQIWRTVALVMIGVTLVMAYFVAEARQRADQISRLALHNNTMGQLEKLIGPTYKNFIGNPNCRLLSFKSKVRNSQMSATLLLDAQNQQAFLLVLGIDNRPLDVDELPRTYTLRAVLANESREEVDFFDNTRKTTGFRIDNLTASQVTAVSWEIVDSSGVTIFSTA